MGHSKLEYNNAKNGQGYVDSLDKLLDQNTHLPSSVGTVNQPRKKSFLSSGKIANRFDLCELNPTQLNIIKLDNILTNLKNV